jgi:aspartyl-tRNA(Asn)/glutamyl-tRNA(Gln) amidotransferase subunit C
MARQLSQEDILHVATLARLEVFPQDINSYHHHINRLLDYVALMEEVDTSKVLPLFSLAKEEGAQYQEHHKTHADLVKSSLPVELLLKNAPSKYQSQFCVDAVIEEGE